jgi:hypothetical protein
MLCSVLSVGPTFTIAGRANVDAEVDVGLSVGINYKLQNAAFAFPQSSAAPSSGSPTPEDSRTYSRLSLPGTC